MSTQTMPLAEVLAKVRLPLTVHVDRICTKGGAGTGEPMHELHHTPSSTNIARLSVYSRPTEAAYLAHAAKVMPGLVALLKTADVELAVAARHLGESDDPSDHDLCETLSALRDRLLSELSAAQTVEVPQ